METLGDRVRAARTSLKLTQGQLAARVTKAGFPMGQTGISNIENRGDTQPQCIYQLAIALDVTVEWLQTGKGEKKDNHRGIRPFSLDTLPEIPGLPDLHARATGRFGVWWFQEQDTNYDGREPLPEVTANSQAAQAPILPKDVPVFPTDGIIRSGGIRRQPQGADFAASVMIEQVSSFTIRPPFLFGREDVYCLQIKEDNLSPWRERGEPVYVDRQRPPRLGSHALIKFAHDDSWFDELRKTTTVPIIVARIVSANEASIRLGLYEPKEEFDVRRSDIAEMLRIFEWHELFAPPNE